MEIAEVRKRLRRVVDESRRAAAARRQTTDAAETAYDRFLDGVATPVFQMFATALRGDGYSFTVFTPKGGLRLASARSAEDYIELSLDKSADQPVVVARVSRGRGRRFVSRERPVRELTPPEQLTEEDVLQMLLREIAPFVER